MITKTQNPKLHAIEVECEVTRGQRSQEVGTEVQLVSVQGKGRAAAMSL